MELDALLQQELNGDPIRHQALKVLQSFAVRPLEGRSKRLHVRFMTRPCEVTGSNQVDGLDVERTTFDIAGRLVGTGQIERLPVQMVVRSVGYRGLPVEGLPFDATAGVIPNQHGAVVVDGEPVPGVYVAGWIKHGPNGLIGTNRKDALDTVTTLFADLRTLPLAKYRDTDRLLTTLPARGGDVIDWARWQQIDAAEIVRGEPAGRNRAKIYERDELLAVATSIPATVSQAATFL